MRSGWCFGATKDWLNGGFMLESIRIEGFRRFDEMALADLGQINLILGNNNVGKTSILEAVYTLACGQKILPLLNIPVARARYALYQNPYWLMEELLAMVHDRKSLPLRMLFEAVDDGHIARFEHRITPSDLLGEYDSSYKAAPAKTLSRTDDNMSAPTRSSLFPMPNIMSTPSVSVARWEVEHGGTTAQLDVAVPQVQISDQQPFRLAKYMDVLSHTATAEIVSMYASIKRERMVEEVVGEIGKVFPDIVGFDMIPYPDTSQAPISVVKQDGSILPLYAYGDGVQKWFYVLGAMSVYKHSIACIDEVDTGLHPKAQEDFAVSVAENALRNDVQVFATTHNIEFVDNFLAAMSSGRVRFGDRVRIITLREVDGKVKVRNMSAVEACKARDSYNLELR